MDPDAGDLILPGLGAKERSGIIYILKSCMPLKMKDGTFSVSPPENIPAEVGLCGSCTEKEV